ncbi:hypothetical protein [Qipengyuania gelatinilytica]|uniref:Uncharacterized protein n=1 Tax=Qipengyuania gelatinilytica TaxID=2867231 RepID=A0ABX9A7N1_9SPHN|nr:hypothetical protein [Qipengyuania gelatinilytica]QZD95268.1 hypothetical protein K3136_00625 [Qipengyuania gelatinilytica]
MIASTDPVAAGEDRAPIKLKVFRVVLGIAIPAPLLFLSWLGWAINNTYFRDSYDEAAYLRTAALYCAPLVLAGGLVAFVKLNSLKAGRVALVAGAILLAVISVYFWSRP